jgi:hypothetical protein
VSVTRVLWFLLLGGVLYLAVRSMTTDVPWWAVLLTGLVSGVVYVLSRDAVVRFFRGGGDR